VDKWKGACARGFTLLSAPTVAYVVAEVC
jgi:hypothetical protein